MNLVTFRNIQEVEHVRQLVSKKGGRSTARQWIGLSKEGSSRKKRGFYDDYEYEDNLGESSLCVVVIFKVNDFYYTSQELIINNW